MVDSKMSEFYVYRDEPCNECNGMGGSIANPRRPGLAFSCCEHCINGTKQTKIFLIDALRELGIDVPEPEKAPAAVCPP